MDPLGFGSFVQRVSAAPPILWIVWGGAAVITIVLVILMRTRWGKTRVLRKCVLLSLFAHVLLGAYAWTVKIVGAPGPPGDDSSLLVTNVKTVDEAEQSQPPAAKPWHTTSLRAGEVPVTGPERTRVDLTAPLERSVTEPRTFDAPPLGTEAEPLTPRSSARPMEAAPAEHSMPAASRENVSPPPPAKQATARLSPSSISEMPRQSVPSDVPPLARQLPETNAQWLDSSRHLTDDEPRPISAVDRTLAAKGAGARIAEGGVPAANDGSLDEPGAQPQIASRNAARSVSDDGPPRLAADANAQRAQPQREPEATTSVEPTPRRPHEVPKTYEHRLRADRDNVVRQQGGSPDTEAAVKAALAWLAANQEPAGYWDAAKHGAQYERTQSGNDARGHMRADTGVTGLALLAFLGAGHTHQGNQYRDNVRRGLDSLIQAQADDGSLSGNATTYAAMYCHGMATLALAEAYGMTGDAKLLPPLRRAVAYTLAAQSPHHGGWRYRPNDPWGDTSQFGWQVMALKAAETAGIESPVASRHGMLRFLDYVSSGRHGGLACYLCRIQIDGTRYLDAPTPTMTAEALFCRFLLGTTPENPLCQEAADYLLRSLPADGRPDLYYWYYGTLAMYQLQGPGWDTWNRAVQRRILQLQERNGSWGTSDRWGGHGGRVFTTALATLTLEVYYRYTPAARAPR
jgi:hypothetical protein